MGWLPMMFQMPVGWYDRQLKKNLHYKWAQWREIHMTQLCFGCTLKKTTILFAQAYLCYDITKLVWWAGAWSAVICLVGSSNIIHLICWIHQWVGDTATQVPKVEASGDAAAGSPGSGDDLTDEKGNQCGMRRAVTPSGRKLPFGMTLRQAPECMFNGSYPQLLPFYDEYFLNIIDSILFAQRPFA